MEVKIDQVKSTHRDGLRRRQTKRMTTLAQVVIATDA